MEIKELKAKAYDLVLMIENAQAQLRQINQAIAQEIQKEQSKPKQKPKDEKEPKETKE